MKISYAHTQFQKKIDEINFALENLVQYHIDEEFRDDLNQYIVCDADEENLVLTVTEVIFRRYMEFDKDDLQNTTCVAYAIFGFATQVYFEMRSHYKLDNFPVAGEKIE